MSPSIPRDEKHPHAVMENPALVSKREKTQPLLEPISATEKKLDIEEGVKMERFLVPQFAMYF